jgi:NAD(P)-dependent dehydrogenase (short-subunit alcohol dehydrogenase family)
VPTVLVTGAARGIGRATVLYLAERGWSVVAGVRNPDDGESLASVPSTTTIGLDITDPGQVAALEANLPAQLDAVVNNAGIVVGGPLEAVPIADIRRQIEVNVLGQLAVTQAVLPRLRASRGRIVFISSLSGRVATPMFGPYNASKFALEGAADALRMELAPWGIRVSLVEPAQTDTDLWRRADEDLDQFVEALSPSARQLYARHIEGFRKSIPRSQRMAAPTEGVCKAIETALTARRPRARYVVGGAARTQAILSTLTPTPLLDRIRRLGTGVPRRAG